MFIIIDALDECDARIHSRAILKPLETLRTKSSSSIFITSRSYPDDIKKTLGSAPRMIVGAEDDDLQRYISRAINNGNNFDVIDGDFREETS